METAPKKISEFSSGIYKQQKGYRSFYPEPVNARWLLDSPELISLLSDADRKLGELNAFSQLVPDIDFFIRMHIAKEATSSSRIEGTETDMEEAFLQKENLDPEKRNDWDEVHNYINAINHSINRLKELPVSTRLIRETHQQLMQGVRGQHKLPGEYRRSQNWIGATLKDAVFIPPHHQDLDELLGDLEKFINSDDTGLPHLIKIAIIHYQFETIHPFLDGNGRIGRLLITLYLVSNGLLHKPALYLSDFFERNRAHYYDNLHRVRTHHDMIQWIKFFLSGIVETAERSIQTFKEIIRLKEKTDRQLPVIFNTRRLENARRIVQLLYQNPVISLPAIQEELKMDKSTAGRMIYDFLRMELLKEKTGFKRNRLFRFEDYLGIFGA